jgi:glycosidase
VLLEYRVRTILEKLYGEKIASNTWQHLQSILDEYRQKITPQNGGANQLFSEKDSILIAYADQVQEPGKPCLQSLADFLERYIENIIPGVHILPFFPYSSDDGFSIVNYRQVNPHLGDWEDIARLSGKFHLMFDAVINHCSVQSAWFQKFLEDDPNYQSFFIVVEGDPDLSDVVRPRALPLLTRFKTASGEKAVWTTFSSDQVDLNYQNPIVLLAIIDLLLFYVSHGAKYIRLDAIAYLWKEIGTPCIHLPQTHLVIRLFRAVLDMVAPQVVLITETNVPHSDNVSYFGDGTDEAQMVYNFSLPPLVLHSLHSGNASAISQWVAGLKAPSQLTTFFNFLASHDGIGLNPVRGIISDEEIDALVEMTLQNGGVVSYKSNPDGTQSPYELNINFFDALAKMQGEFNLNIQIDRFLLAHAIMFAVSGVPGIYFHSLFGSRGWREGVEKSGHNRSINRQKLSRSELERELSDPQSLRQRIFKPLTHMLRIRAGEPGFHPNNEQHVLDFGEAILAIMRASPDGKDQILCLNNLSGESQSIGLNLELWKASGVIDLMQNHSLIGTQQDISLRPFQFQWLRLIF